FSTRPSAGWYGTRAGHLCGGDPSLPDGLARLDRVPVCDHGAWCDRDRLRGDWRHMAVLRAETVCDPQALAAKNDAGELEPGEMAHRHPADSDTRNPSQLLALGMDGRHGGHGCLCRVRKRGIVGKPRAHWERQYLECEICFGSQ